MEQPAQTKICSKCGEEKPIDEFTKNIHFKDKKDKTCRLCKKEQYHLWTTKKKKFWLENNPTETGKKIKTCCVCKKNKEKSYFSINRGRPDGLSTCCKKCNRKMQRDKHKKRIDYWKNKNPYEYNEGIKKCPSCLETKNILFFNKSHSSPDGLGTFCRDCANKKLNRIRRAKKTISDNDIFDGTPKKCKRCNRTFPRTKPWWTRSDLTLDMLGGECKTCRNVRYLMITSLEKIKILDLQKNMCAICSKTLDVDNRNSHVDHNHSVFVKELAEMVSTENKIKSIRGILCHHCNHAFLPTYEKIRSTLPPDQRWPLLEEYLNNPPAQKVLRELDST